MQNTLHKFWSKRLTWVVLCAVPSWAVAQVSQQSGNGRQYSNLNAVTLQAALDSATQRMTVPSGSALNTQDTAYFSTDVQFSDRIIVGSWAVGEDAGIPTGMTANEYFGYSTLLIEANAPSLALVDSSESDQAWYHWSWATGHPHNDTLEAFVLEQGTSGKIPLFFEANAPDLALRANDSGIIIGQGIQVGSQEPIITGTPDTVGLAAGSLAYWNGEQLITLPGGTDGQTLNWCSGKPTWGPCPTPEALAFGSLTVTSPAATAFNITAPISSWGTAEVFSISLLVSNDASPAAVDTLETAWSAGDPTIASNFIADAGIGNYTFQFAAETSTGWVNSGNASAASTSASFTCGDPVVVDGTSYATDTWADRCWFLDYLNTTTYSDGTPLTQMNDAAEWSSGTATPAYVQTNFNDPIDAAHPLQYNFAALAAADMHLGLCPVGWRITDFEDWSDAIAAGPIGTSGTLNVVNTPYFNGSYWSSAYPQTLGFYNPYTFVWTPVVESVIDLPVGPGLTPSGSSKFASLAPSGVSLISMTPSNSAPIRCVQ